MTISTIALDKIKNSSKILNLLAAASGRSEMTIRRWVENNDDNLTKASALQVIREETGLTDSEILTESTVKS